MDDLQTNTSLCSQKSCNFQADKDAEVELPILINRDLNVISNFCVLVKSLNCVLPPTVRAAHLPPMCNCTSFPSIGVVLFCENVS